jgi:hypothetical protein
MRTLIKIIIVISFPFFAATTNPGFSQSSLPDTPCDDYPTSDEMLNGLVKNLVGNMSEFTSKMTSIYLRLTQEEQSLALTYMSKRDRNLFQRFPQFEDIEVQNAVVLVWTAYSSVLERFSELFPGANYDERIEKTNNIIKCCAAKNADAQFESSDSNRFDDCVITRKNCLRSAVSAATIMHLGCAVADLGIITGILCHAAVLAWQIAESNICDAEYKQCKEKQ